MKDKPVVLVTGASRGIGEATAVKFARGGYNVTLVARGRDALDGVAKRVRDAGGDALVCAGDLADLDVAKSAVDETVRKWDRIDALINNAAWRTHVTMRHISVETWERTITICLTTPAFLARWSAEHMERRGRGGVILNVSSIMSRQAAGTSPAYVSSKGALDSLSYELAALYGRAGIRVVAVNPGWVDTEASNDYVTPDGEDLSDKLQAWASDAVPLGRGGTPDEVANALFWLASSEASYVTGTRFVIDGGWHHQHTPYTFKRALLPEEFG